MERPLQSLRYLTAFRCVADACVDTCCAGLRVTVDRASLERLQRLTADGDPLSIRDQLEPGAPDAAPDQAASIRMDAQGACPFLDAQRLCGVQQRYGLAGLGDACAQFPRATRAGPEVDRVAGSLACPETLRLLLSTDDPLAWVEVGADFLPRRPALTPTPGADEGPDHEAFERAMVRGLLQQEVPLGARWLLSGELCEERTREVSDDVSEPRGKALRARWEAHPTPERSARAQLLVTSLELPVTKLLTLLAEIVTLRLAAPHPPRVAAYLLRAGPPSTLPERYREVRRALATPTLLRLERNLSLAAANALIRNPVEDARELGIVMLRSALAAVLLTLELAGTDASDAQVDARSVETLQLLAKYVDASPALLDRAHALFDVPPEERLRRVLLLALVFPQRAAVWPRTTGSDVPREPADGSG